MTAAILRIARAGYNAARIGVSPAANPWPAGSYRGAVWADGWRIGDLPPIVRALFAWVLL